VRFPSALRRDRGVPRRSLRRLREQVGRPLRTATSRTSPSRKTRFSSQPLDFTWNFPASPNSRMSSRRSVLTTICRSRVLPMDPPDTATVRPVAIRFGVVLESFRLSLPYQRGRGRHHCQADGSVKPTAPAGDSAGFPRRHDDD
jgi:hypothetical protein